MIQLVIKNMVCSRCILVVENMLKDLKIAYTQIDLGVITMPEMPHAQQMQLLDEKLKAIGFERIDDKKQQLITQTKSFIIQQVHQNKTPLQYNWSVYLSEQLNVDYHALTQLFSSIEGITIEQYIIRQKVERIKELLIYNQLSISKIAWEMGYSSVAHLSNQFKKVTGFSPAQFKKVIQQSTEVVRKPIDKV